MIRAFLAAGLVDHMHIAVVPILLGKGARFEGRTGGAGEDFEADASSPRNCVTHLTFTRVRD